VNLEEALKILKEQDRIFEKVKGGYLEKCPFYTSWNEIVSARQVINTAKSYTSEGTQRSVKKNLKQSRREKNRSATKEDIHHERYDNFSKNNLRKDGDPWDWS
jgi:hypothetical protein